MQHRNLLSQKNPKNHNRRELPIAALQARFENRMKLRPDEIDRLFKKDIKKPLDKEQYRFLEKGIRKVVVFDIESMNFDARMGFIICWYALRWDVVTGKKEMIWDKLEKPDMKSGYKEHGFKFDKRILGTLSQELREADLVAGHYISKFDLPFFTARCHITDQDELVPDYMDFRVMDTWRITKTKYNLYNSGGNSLRNAGRVVIRHDGKTSVDLEIWKTIYYADNPKWQTALKYICDHCEIDVWQNYDLFRTEAKRVPIGGSSV